MVENESPRIRRIRIGQLQFGNRLPGEVWKTTLGLENRLVRPGALTDNAVLLLCAIHPVHVVENGLRTFDVVANHTVANLLLRLPKDTRVPVLIWPQAKFASPQVSMLLSHLLFGLQAGQQSTILKLFDLLSASERESLSPDLKSRSGLERLSGVSRKYRLEEPEIIPAKDRQLSFGMEDDAGE